MFLWVLLGCLVVGALWKNSRDRDATLTLTFLEGVEGCVTATTTRFKVVLEINDRCYTARTWPWTSPQGIVRKLRRAIQRGESRHLPYQAGPDVTAL